jgi:adenylate cyclase
MPAGLAKSDSARRPGEEEIRAQLARITDSAAFDSSRRSIDFLRFVVEEALAGREHAISQQAIAQRVFGRGKEFDPTTDPIVRMQAGRVRRSLDHYYLTAGAGDPLLISLPKGSYVPSFAFRDASASATAPTAESASGEAWPKLLVSPLRNLTDRPEMEFIAQGLAFDLAAELNRYASISVFLAPAQDAALSNGRLPRFELTGALALRGDELRITFQLVDSESGRQTWAHSHSCPAGPARSAALDEIVQATAAAVAEEHGVLASQVGWHSPQQATTPSVYEAILRHHYCELTHEPQAFVDALEALRRAVDACPDCALAWTYLARLSGIHWSLGIPGDIIPIEQSIAYARRGAELAPLDVRSRVVLAYVLLLGDEVDAARAEANTALDVSGMSLFWLDAVGYLLTLSGDWQRGPALVRKAVQVNPFPRRACYCALWLDAVRRDDSEEALAAARKSSPDAYFWSPLMQAVALVEAGRIEEADASIERLLEMKPDFPQRAEWLIRRYVKFDDLSRKVEGALKTAGLTAARKPTLG